MESRLNVHEKGHNALKTIYATGTYVSKSSVELNLRQLVYILVSQMNNCAFCIDMHYKEARATGEPEWRLFDLSAWREASWYSSRERAALALAEAITHCNVCDSIYSEAKKYFSDEELIDLALAVTTINTWNRINNVFTSKPGTYRVGQFDQILQQH